MATDASHTRRRRRKSINPFYILLGILGALFVVTGCACGLALFRATQPAERGANRHSPHRLFELVENYGHIALAAELGLLAAATWAAIGTDDYWSGRTRRRPNYPTKGLPNEN